MASSAIFENKNALQEDELEAIKAIFFNVKDLRLNDVWKVRLRRNLNDFQPESKLQ